ncbi:MAG TPA: hypothetical protein VFW93_10185 [Aquabacterium sp.]|uniref:hypothetical protein n=1 Tax=Aquabacterium sp. TaxID=1872578 RepID=UPI002E304A1D|nr:hypothetical protein [Aquabacterium sp.]HEX5356576.1 hypothetical protein [Aquabacterium sp.]
MNHRTPAPKQGQPHAGHLLCFLMAVVFTSSMAQTTTNDQPARPSQSWRCTATSGQISYSQHPCEAGGELVTLKDARTQGQQRQAKDNNERDAKLARRMQRERRHEERMAAKEDAISLSGNGKPHVIRSTPNTHAPVPISDMTRPIRIKSNKKAAPSSTLPSAGTAIRAL